MVSERYARHGSAFLEIRVRDRSGLRGAGLRITPLKKAALFDTATYWHRKIFPQHFAPGNAQKYHFDPRSKGYIFQKKLKYGQGLGRTVMLRFSNMSERWMRTLAYFTGTSQRVTAHLPAPLYFKYPFVGQVTLASGRTIAIERQPDKVSEALRMTPDDLQDLRQAYIHYLTQRVSEALGRPVKPVVNGL